VHVLDFSFPPTARRHCRIRVGTGVLDALVEDLVVDAPGSPLILVSDSTVAPIHARPLLGRLRERGLRAELLQFPAGELSKTRATKAALEDGLLRHGAGRDAAIVAVGGGVTGDVAGFTAATWHRGIPVIQVPTSLLSMVDAAVGGKTGVNVEGAKNLVGSFHQPWGIYADISMLTTLADTEFREGFSEVVKSAIIGDASLFRWLEAAASKLVRRDAQAVERVVLACMRLKGRVVKRDEREAGRRAALNFGHTVAHALEKVSGNVLGHGSAVALGLCVESRMACATTGLAESSIGRIEALLDAFGLPVRIPPEYGADAIVAASAYDKKVRAGQVHYALPLRVGRMPALPQLTCVVDETVLREALHATR